MYAILAVALLSNSFDMIGGPPSTFDMIGDIPQVQKVEETDEESNPVADNVVFVYVDLDDHKSFRKISEDSDQIEGLSFKFRDGRKRPQGGEKYSLPLLHYHTDRGWVFDSGWNGSVAFAQRWAKYNSGSDLLVENASESVRKSPPNTQSSVNGHYPVRGSWWTGCSGWQHLTQGVHAGKFDAAWLRSLSNAEVQSLHSDDHEGRVKWAYVNRPAIVASQSVASPQPRRRGFLGFGFSRDYYCPNGNCPR